MRRREQSVRCSFERPREVIALRDGGEPIDFLAADGERYRLRIARGGVPPVSPQIERDDRRVVLRESSTYRRRCGYLTGRADDDVWHEGE